MAIEIKAKPKRKSNIVKYALYGSVALLLIALISYGVLYYLGGKAESKLSSLEKEMEQQMTGQRKQLEEKVEQAQQKIERASLVIESHRSIYNFLEILGANAHPEVRYTRLNLRPDYNQVELRGITETFTTLDQQIDELRNHELIEQVKINKSSIESRGRVGFVTELTLKPEIFKFPPR